MQYKKIELKKTENKVKSSTKDKLLDELLALRNIINEDEIDNFLNPSKKDFLPPENYSDMQKAKDRIFKAIAGNETILVWGDFDCDGVTSTSVLYKALKELNANVITFIPDRLLHGHGLNSKELIKFVSLKRIKLVITVDCATTNISEINLLKGLGVDTIVTDHHETDMELPNAFCIINPQVKGAIKDNVNVSDITSMSYNSGSVVAYKLAMELLKDNENENLKDELLVIASCGAIADVVPLIGENRAMVSEALNILNTKKENSHKGIYKLLSSNVNEKNITSYDIAFMLAPRINAVGRLENAKTAFNFLTESNDSKLDIIIEELNQYNTIRQSKCHETYEEIKEYLKNHKEEQKNPAIILLNKSWHIGIIGIVASKIMEEYNKPCFLMTVDDNNNARCSIRSNGIINVYEVLKENENLFSGFGGHKLAGGCSFDLSQQKFEIVKEALLKSVDETKTQTDNGNILYADIELKSEDLELNILDTVNQLEPFGQNNNPPIFAMFDVTLEDFKAIGKEQNHLKINISSQGKTFNCIRWNENELLIPPKSKCDIAFYPRLNTYNDIKSIQLEIIDMYSVNLEKKNKGLKVFDHRRKTDILDSISQYLSKSGIDIAVWAKKPNTKEILSKYSDINKNIVKENEIHNGLMFFDYPANFEQMEKIISDIKPNKIHFMNCKIDENLENHVKQINGMIKYCSNKLNGNIDIPKMALALEVSEEFINIALEILENIGSIDIKDIDKIEYIKPFNYDEFKNNSMFDSLKKEFDNVLEFKKTLLNCELKDIEEMMEKIN